MLKNALTIKLTAVRFKYFSVYIVIIVVIEIGVKMKNEKEVYVEVEGYDANKIIAGIMSSIFASFMGFLFYLMGLYHFMNAESKSILTLFVCYLLTVMCIIVSCVAIYECFRKEEKIKKIKIIEDGDK